MKLFQVLKEGHKVEALIVAGPRYIAFRVPLTWRRVNPKHFCWEDLYCNRSTIKWLGIKIYYPKFIILECH